MVALGRGNEVVRSVGGHVKSPRLVPSGIDPCVRSKFSGFGGLEVACWPLVPKFADLNPAEAVGFFRAKKSSARLPSEGK